MLLLPAIAQSVTVELSIKKYGSKKVFCARLRAEATEGLLKYSGSENYNLSPGRLWAPLFDRSKASRPSRPGGASTRKPARAPRKVDSTHWPARYRIPPSLQDSAPWH